MPTKKTQLSYLLAYFVVFILNGVQRFILDKELAFLAPLLLYPIFCGWGVYLFRETLARGWKNFRCQKARSVGFVIGGHVANQFLTIVLALLSMAIMQLLNLQTELDNDQNISRVMEMVPAFITLPILSLIGPMVEELIFRQILQENLKNYLSTWLAVFVQAVLFGCIHIHHFEVSEFVLIIPHIASGFVFGAIREKTGNIWLAILPHFLNNFLGLLLYIL